MNLKCLYFSIGLFLFGAVFMAFSACKKAEILPDWTTLSVSQTFAAGKKTGTVAGNFVPELSGLAASRQLPGAFWAHGDGKATSLFLIDSTGQKLATMPLPESVTDIEGIASGFDADGRAVLFVGDIGDNDLARKKVKILRIIEPEWVAGQALPVVFPMPQTLPTLEFGYPAGESFNAEALLFDAPTGELFVVTKDKTAFVFAVSTTSAVAEKLVELPIEKATAGDIRPDGRAILLKNKQQIFYWELGAGETVRTIFQQKTPETVPYQPETQGEAICFDVWQTGFFTSTERANASAQPIWFYSKQ